jgi:hypothetical protein
MEQDQEEWDQVLVEVWVHVYADSVLVSKEEWVEALEWGKE